MAGTGKFKIGSELKFKDNLGSPLKCGDYVRNTITGTEGVITQYGVVKSNNGNYKLCDNIWEVITPPSKEEAVDLGFTKSPIEVKEVKKDVAVVENTETGEKKIAVVCERPLESFSNDELLDEVLKRNFPIRTLEDQYLADELRRRGYEVTAEKTVKVSL